MKSVEWLPIYRYTGNDAGGLKIFFESLGSLGSFPFSFWKDLLEDLFKKSIFEKVSESLRYEGF